MQSSRSILSVLLGSDSNATNNVDYCISASEIAGPCSAGDAESCAAALTASAASVPDMGLVIGIIVYELTVIASPYIRFPSHVEF